MKFKFLIAFLLGAVMSASAQGYQDGIEYYKADQFANAKTILERTLNNADTDKSLAYYYLGEIALRDGNKVLAKQYFDNGIAANAENPYNYVGLATLDLLNGNEDAAKENIKLAEKFGKKNNEVTVAIARAYYVADPEVYAKQISKYIEKATKDSKRKEPSIYILKGDMLAAADSINEAVEQYGQAVYFGPEQSAAYVKSANIYFVINPTSAIEMLETLLSLQPNSALAQRELAIKYYDNGQFAKAAELYGQYVKNPNHFREDEERYTVLLFANGKFAEAFDFAQSCEKSFLIQRMMFWSKAALKDYDAAVKYAEEFFSANQGGFFSTNDYAYYGDVLVELKQDSLALVQFEKAIAVDTVKNTGLYERVSKIHENNGNLYQAALAYEKYVNGKAQISPNDYLNVVIKFAKSATADTTETRMPAVESGLKYIELGLPKVAEQSKFMFLSYKVTLLSAKANNDNTTPEVMAALKELVAALEVDATVLEKQNKLYVNVCGMIGQIANEQKDYATALTYYEKALAADPTKTQLEEVIAKLKTKVK